VKAIGGLHGLVRPGIWLLVPALLFSCGRKENPRKSVKVTRRTIVEKALAVGTIEPENEISVKSKISGVVKHLYADPGDFVHKGDPLLEIRPDPTPLELAEAKRNVQLARIDFEEARKQKQRVEKLLKERLVSQREYDQAFRSFEEAKLRMKMAQERLALIENGKVKIANTEIESVIKAPIEGYVLERFVDVGDPVVPLTSYQAGTELMTLADMSHLVFKGTVDEIDVGKIHEGMEAVIDIGALPGEQKIRGRVRTISLKAKKEGNITVFPVEIELVTTDGLVLRAGYSANATIIVARKENVLAIPERVVTFRGDSTFVDVPGTDGSAKSVAIQTGLSDAIYLEVVSGLKEGQEVLEKPIKEIQ